MKAVKTIIQYTLTIILTLMIFAYFVITLFSNTILKKQYLIDQIESANYYSKIYEDVKSNFEKYIEQSGFEVEILENIVTEEKVKKDTQIIINNLYDGTNQEIDTQEIKDNVNANILESLENKKINQTQKNAIDTFIAHLCNEYTETISHFSVENQIYQIYKKVIQYTNLAKKLIIIFIILDILLLFMINLKKIHKFVSLVGVSLSSTGILMIITNLFINGKIKIQTITILNNSISEILRNILVNIFDVIAKGGAYMLTIGIILIFLANLIHNIKETRTKENN